jgi:asparagine synthase (glutamine-hydrolysing)
MCGFFGAVIENTGEAPAWLRARVALAEKTQAHRGPDMADTGYFEMGNRLVVLAHQRLSILDLSEHGRQPMRAQDGSSHIVYNGEIYNYQEIAAAQGYRQLTSSSDTEVILERLVRAASPADAFAEFNGMWSLALLDERAGTLTLSRDRAGVKPLYYTIHEGNLYFASEIKTLLVLTGLKFAINRRTVARYIEQSLQDDTNETFFEGIFALPAGTYATLDLRSPITAIDAVSYWDPFAAKARWNYDNPEQTFRDLVMDAVRLRLRSDVPVGQTLSGGLDSSIITHAMRAQLGHSEFTVLSAVSPKAAEDESRFVDVMAEAYHLNVTKIDLSWKPEEAMALMAKATWHNDSPLGSFSNVAFYLLMQAAQKHGVKVILSGQGADELLGGYKKFLGFYVKHLLRSKHYGRAALTLAQFVFNGTVINQFSLAEAKRYFVKSTTDSILTAQTLAAFTRAPIASIGDSFAYRQWLDYRQYSVPFLTHYEDRMSMAFGREIRLPYLDYRLVEFLLNAPDNLKLNHGWTKWLMRDAFKDLLPKAIIWRKDKQGFVNPQAQWLKHELRGAIEARFADGARMYRYGLIDAASLRGRYAAYCEGKSGIWYRDIFNPLALEVWLEQFEPYIKG